MHRKKETMSTVNKYQLDYLDQLESEAIHILREVAGQFERPALLFSGGKDSITLVHLALKAFRPGKFPFPLVHIDTGHNFPEALDFRDQLAAGIGEKLVVRKVADTIKARHLTEPTGKFASRNALQTYTLLDTIEEFGFDACIGGARRDEEKARAKEWAARALTIEPDDVMDHHNIACAFAQMGELDMEFGDPWERAASEAGLPVDVVSKTEVRP